MNVECAEEYCVVVCAIYELISLHTTSSIYWVFSFRWVFSGMSQYFQYRSWIFSSTSSFLFPHLSQYFYSLHIIWMHHVFSFIFCKIHANKKCNEKVFFEVFIYNLIENSLSWSRVRITDKFLKLITNSMNYELKKMPWWYAVLLSHDSSLVLSWWQQLITIPTQARFVIIWPERIWLKSFQETLTFLTPTYIQERV